LPVNLFVRRSDSVEKRLGHAGHLPPHRAERLRPAGLGTRRKVRSCPPLLWSPAPRRAAAARHNILLSPFGSVRPRLRASVPPGPARPRRACSSCFGRARAAIMPI